MRAKGLPPPPAISPPALPWAIGAPYDGVRHELVQVGVDDARINHGVRGRETHELGHDNNAKTKMAAAWKVTCGKPV